MSKKRKKKHKAKINKRSLRFKFLRTAIKIPKNPFKNHQMRGLEMFHRSPQPKEKEVVN